MLRGTGICFDAVSYVNRGNVYRNKGQDEKAIADFYALTELQCGAHTGAPILCDNPETGKRELAFACWGLIPSWAKDAKFGYRTINALAETVAEKPSFREVQRVPDLLPAIKKTVDNDTRAGQYLLTGSTNIQALAGDRSFTGILLYSGEHIASFGENMHAIPFGSL